MCWSFVLDGWWTGCTCLSFRIISLKQTNFIAPKSILKYIKLMKRSVRALTNHCKTEEKAETFSSYFVHNRYYCYLSSFSFSRLSFYVIKCAYLQNSRLLNLLRYAAIYAYKLESERQSCAQQKKTSISTDKTNLPIVWELFWKFSRHLCFDFVLHVSTLMASYMRYTRQLPQMNANSIEKKIVLYAHR